MVMNTLQQLLLGCSAELSLEKVYNKDNLKNLLGRNRYYF